MTGVVKPFQRSTATRKAKQFEKPSVTAQQLGKSREDKFDGLESSGMASGRENAAGETIIPLPSLGDMGYSNC